MKNRIKTHDNGETTTTFFPNQTEKQLLIDMLHQKWPHVWTEVRTGGTREHGVREHRAMLQLQHHGLAKFFKSESITTSRYGIRITRTLWSITAEGEELAKKIKKHQERFQ